MSRIKWYNLNKQGYILDNNNKIIWPLKEKGGIYVYRTIINNIEKLYIGSSINLQRRFSQHRHRALIHQETFKYNTTLYNYIVKYGWNKFQYSVLKSLDWNFNLKDNRKKLLLIEEEYIKKYSPKLNINKVINSGLIETNYEFLPAKRKKLKKLIIKPSPNQSSIIKMKLHKKGITVNLFTKEKVLIKTFNTMRKMGEYVQLSASTISNYIKNNKIWNNNYYFTITYQDTNKISMNFPLENYKKNQEIFIDNTINKLRINACIFEVSLNNKIIYRFNSIRNASKFLNISYDTLTNYSKKNKLWKNKYKFNIIRNNK